jgi:hypothetical protein
MTRPGQTPFAPLIRILARREDVLSGAVGHLNDAHGRPSTIEPPTSAGNGGMIQRDLRRSPTYVRRERCSGVSSDHRTRLKGETAGVLRHVVLFFPTCFVGCARTRPGTPTRARARRSPANVPDPKSRGVAAHHLCWLSEQRMRPTRFHGSATDCTAAAANIANRAAAPAHGPCSGPRASRSGAFRGADSDAPPPSASAPAPTCGCSAACNQTHDPSGPSALEPTD